MMKHMALTMKHMPEKFSDARNIMEKLDLLRASFFGERVYG
jgi:hypothetical protein